MKPIAELITTPSASSDIARPTKPRITRDSHAALFALINKSRLLNGWMMRTAQELDPTIRAWHELFTEYSIPISAYEQLYKRAFEFRQRRMNQGQDCPTMDCTLLVSQWTGENGLQKELREKARIAADKQLAMGGEKCPDDIAEKFKEFGVRI